MAIGIDGRPLIVLFAIAVIARVLAAGLLGAWTDPLRTMPLEEVVLAQRLATGQGYTTPYIPPGSLQFPRYPSAHSPPGYPYLLSFVIRAIRCVSSDPIRPYQFAIAIGVVTGAMVPLLLAAAARRQGGAIAFWVTGLLAALHPALVLTSAALWDTPFMLLAVSMAVFWAVVGFHDRRPSTEFARGLIVGASTLFNPVAAPMLLVARLLHLRDIRSNPAARRAALSMAAGWLICLITWTLRNAVEFHRFIPVRNNFGLELCLGNQDGADGTTPTACRHHPMDDLGERRLVADLTDDRYMQAKADQAISWIRANPVVFTKLTCRRVALYWFGTTGVPAAGSTTRRHVGLRLVQSIGYTCTLALTMLGIRRWSSGPGKWLVILGLLVMPVPYYLTHVSGNYRATIVPLMCVPMGVYLADVCRDAVTRVGRRFGSCRTAAPILPSGPARG